MILSFAGSPELAAALERANHHTLRSIPDIPAPSKIDVDFTFTGEGYRTGDVSASLRIKNNSASPRSIKVHMCAAAAYYTGVPANDLKENSLTALLEPHAGQFLFHLLEWWDYACVDFLASEAAPKS